MDTLLIALEGSALGQLMRAAGGWTYGIVNLAHILSVATLFGSMLVLDLRLLGLWRHIPLAMLERPTLSLALVGFVLAVLSGLCLLTTNATEYYGNPFLLLKLGAVGGGFANALIAQRLAAWRLRGEHPLPAAARWPLAWVGGTSLACWLTAVAAGRLIAYW